MNKRRKLIAPYEGNAQYIFVSYSHKNKDYVLSIIERLQKDGYRIWYDEGIHPGSEWDEYIAQHVDNCSFFLAFLSEEYLDSSNCKDELKYAREIEKNSVLIYLRPTKLPPGMRLRLGRLQSIKLFAYEDEEAFYDKLYTSVGIEPCKEIVSDYEQPEYAVYNRTSHEEVALDYGSHVIGRSSRKCKILIEDKLVSLVHGILTVNREAASILDLNSKNGIFVNGQKIESNKEYALHDQDVIRMGYTELIFKVKPNKNSE